MKTKSFSDPNENDSSGSREDLKGGVGEFRCLHCWLKFDGNNIKRIAVHPDLKGDEKLGADAPMRFTPKKFNGEGEPLDPFDLVAPEKACPHCHNRLPQGFTELPHLVFSPVGATCCGKNTYLSILPNRLRRTLYEKMNVSFGDQDPEFNLTLNAQTQQILHATTVETARLAKMQVDGYHYQSLFMDGRIQVLPKPYVFWLGDLTTEGKELSLCFYNNAGEDFEPIHYWSRPKIQHLKWASSLLFMFDPVPNQEFREKFRHKEDAPDWEFDYHDAQEVIFPQMINDLCRPNDCTSKACKPLAVLLMKSDLWMHLMPHSEEIQDPVTEDGLDLEIVDRNSAICRDFMAGMNTTIGPRAAEFISEDVRYFPVSTYGHKAVAVRDEDGGIRGIGPDPHRLQPFQVEVPVIWALSRLAGNLIPIK